MVLELLLSCWNTPPSTTVAPLLTSTWVVRRCVSIAGALPPVPVLTSSPWVSLVTEISMMTRASGVICGVTVRLSTAFLKLTEVAPLEVDC